MQDEYDFSQGKRKAILATKGKTKITIYIDNFILEEFRLKAEKSGTGYQTMMNEALKEYIIKNIDFSVTESALHKIFKEEYPQIM